MKKLSILLTTLTLFLFSSITTFASDGDVVERNVGGTKVTYLIG
ncbi:MAG TPA: hypothetical protein VK119_07875 [Bacillota bacterium]|nr:hypothetical protein [Bacillota bacterium]